MARHIPEFNNAIISSSKKVVAVWRNGKRTYAGMFGQCLQLLTLDIPRLNIAISFSEDPLTIGRKSYRSNYEFMPFEYL